MAIKYQAGTVLPEEYDWKEEFSLEGIIIPYVMMDVGKVRGLAIALEEAQDKIAILEKP